MPPFVLIIATVALLGCFLWLLLYGHRLRSGTASEIASYPGLARLNRWTLLLPYIGVVVAMVALLLTQLFVHSGYLAGTQPTIVPAAMGAVVLFSLMIGELIFFRSARQPGVAGLERRRPTRYIEWPLVALVGVTLIAIVGFIVWRWQGPSIVGVTQFSISGGSPNTATVTISAVTDNSVQVMAELLLAATVLALIAIISITRRPRNGADLTLAALDDVIRRRSQRIAMVVLFGSIIVSLGIGLAVQVPAQSTGAAANNVMVINLPSGGDCVTPDVPGNNTDVICSIQADINSVTYTISVNSPPKQPSDLNNVLVILTMTALMLALIAAAALPPKTFLLPQEDTAQEAVADEPPADDSSAPIDTDDELAVRK